MLRVIDFFPKQIYILALATDRERKTGEVQPVLKVTKLSINTESLEDCRLIYTPVATKPFQDFGTGSCPFLKVDKERDGGKKKEEEEERSGSDNGIKLKRIGM